MCQMNAFAVLGIQEIIVKSVRAYIYIYNLDMHHNLQLSCMTSQISFPVSDSLRANMEARVATMVMVGTAVPALQAMRERTVRMKSMNVCQTLVKTKALAL